MLLLVCVSTALLSLSPNYVAGAVSLPTVADSCGEDDLDCFRRVLLDKQDEVISLGKRIGLGEERVKLLEQAVKLVTEQRDLSNSSVLTLSEAAGKLVPHWYSSPVLWAIVGFVSGVVVTVLTVWGVSQALAR